MNLIILMKPVNAIPVCLGVLLLFSCPVIAGPPAAVEKKPVPAGNVETQDFPLIFKGAEVMITRQTKRPEMEPKLRKILGKNTELPDRSTLQYDVQMNPEQGPLCVQFSWDKKGDLDQVTLDALSEIQNPPAKALKSWLLKGAGAGKTAKSKPDHVTTTWCHSLSEHLSGEIRVMEN